MKNIKLLSVLLLLVLLESCSSLARKHQVSWTVDWQLGRVIDLMKEHSIHRKNVDWVTFEEEVYGLASGAENIQDAYPAIRLALDLLGDQHSMYITRENKFIRGNRRDCRESPVEPYQIPDDVGLIKIPPFNGQGDEALQFARNIQEQIKQQDNQNLKGWMIDLRHNTGGNMWPMLLGISPLLDTDVSGYFTQDKDFYAEDNDIYAWKCEDGKISLNFFYGYELDEQYSTPYEQKKVAVLIDRMTMSSGEAIAVAFKGRKNTRFFGRPTCGLSTGNQQYLLWNGDKLLLTVSYFADRHKNVYGLPIQPDFEIDEQSLVAEKASEWILENNKYAL